MTTATAVTAPAQNFQGFASPEARAEYLDYNLAASTRDAATTIDILAPETANASS